MKQETPKSENETTKELDCLGIIAVSSKTLKTYNEDSGGSYKGKNLSAIAIADGLGSSVDAHIASDLVVKSFLHEVQAIDGSQKELSFEDVKQIWESTAKKIKDYYEKNKNRYQDKPKILETTLITVIELKDSYIVSYLGNGSAWYIRGDFWYFWNHRWPWCMTDLMVGHSFLENGKEVLYGVLGPTGASSNVKMLNISKDREYGEILLLCTDGISSSDHLRVGSDPNNKLWVEVNPHIEKLVNSYLKEFFESIAKATSNVDEILQKNIDRFLNENSFDDDATLGIIISSKAKEHYLIKYGCE